MKKAISIALKMPINPLKRSGVKLGQNWGGNWRTGEGKVWVKWGWISSDKRRIKSVQNASVWRRGRVGYLSDFSARKGLKTRQTESVQASVWRRGHDGINRGVSLGKGLYNRRPKGDQKNHYDRLTSSTRGTSVRVVEIIN